MKHKTSISDTSIDSAGIPADYRQAVAELIWNGFDAKATEVHIRFETNAIDSISQLVISDNGEGIDFESLQDTFGAFLDSRKRQVRQRSSYTRGRKGKGRFAFSAFAHSARWHTVYKREGKYLGYDIFIKSNNKDEYEEDNRHLSRKRATGTDLILTELYGVSAYSFSGEAFLDFLAKEFGWFLLLNRQHQYAIKINGEPLLYDYLIADSDSRSFPIQYRDQEANFTLNYIRWKENIGDKYYYYFLNEERKECAKLLSSHNNNAVGFHHSLFIESAYFDNFQLHEGDQSTTLFGRNQHDPLFKKLMKELATYLDTRHKSFIRETSAGSLLTRFETEGLFPVTGADSKANPVLAALVKELYCLQPRIFKGLKPEQARMMLGMLDVLLRTGMEAHITALVSGMLSLEPEEQQALQEVLQGGKTGDTGPKPMLDPGR